MCTRYVVYERHNIYNVTITRPTNILVDPYLRAATKRRAAERGLSLSAYIWELIRADDTAASAPASDISPLVGILGTGAGPTDIARDKHIMVRQAFSDIFDRQQTRASHE